MNKMIPPIGAPMAASHNWWKFDLGISYILLLSQSILESLSGNAQFALNWLYYLRVDLVGLWD